MNRLQYFFFILTSLLILHSCSGKKETVIPVEVLPMEKMVEVLADIHIQEATYSLNLARRDSSQAGVPLYLSVLKKHGLEQKVYDESFLFYTQHPELMDKVYEDVISLLSKKQAEAGQ